MLSPALATALEDHYASTVHEQPTHDSLAFGSSHTLLFSLLALSSALPDAHDELRIAFTRIWDGSSANLPSLEAVETRASAILEEVQSHIDPPEDRTLAEHITSQIASLHQSNSTLLALHSSILSLLASPIPSPQLSFPPRATKAAEMTLATETLFAAASKFDLVSRTAATSHLLPPNSEASLVPRLGALHRKEVEEMRREVERLEEILQGYDSQMMGDVGVGNRSSKGEKSFTTVLNEYRALGVEEKEIRGDLKRFHR